MKNLKRLSRSLLLSFVVGVSFFVGAVHAASAPKAPNPVNNPQPALPAPIPPGTDLAALVYIEPFSLTNDLVINTINSYGGQSKSVITSNSPAGHAYDVSIDKRNGRNDIYIAYIDQNRNVFELMMIPNNNFSQRTVQSIPFTFLGSPQDIWSVSLEIGTDPVTAQPMPVVAMLFHALSTFNQSTIELAYLSNGNWHNIRNSTTTLINNLYFFQDLGLTLIDQNNITVGTNLVFYIWDSINSNTTSELFSVDYDLIGRINTAPIGIPGSIGLIGSDYAVSNSALIYKSGGSNQQFYCSDRLAGQWSPLGICLQGAPYTAPIKSIVGVPAPIVFVPRAVERNPNVTFNHKDLYLQVIHTSSTSNPLISFLIDRGGTDYFATFINKNFGSSGMTYVAASKGPISSPSVVLFGMDGAGGVPFSTVVEQGTIMHDIKILALD